MDLSEPVVTRLFALGGVLIGGTLQGILNGITERRHDGWAATGTEDARSVAAWCLSIGKNSARRGNGAGLS